MMNARDASTVGVLSRTFAPADVWSASSGVSSVTDDAGPDTKSVWRKGLMQLHQIRTGERSSQWSAQSVENLGQTGRFVLLAFGGAVADCFKLSQSTDAAAFSSSGSRKFELLATRQEIRARARRSSLQYAGSVLQRLESLADDAEDDPEQLPLSGESAGALFDFLESIPRSRRPSLTLTPTGCLLAQWGDVGPRLSLLFQGRTSLVYSYRLPHEDGPGGYFRGSGSASRRLLAQLLPRAVSELLSD